MSALLQIENLSVSFRQEEETITAVKNVSFEIGKSEIIAIAGESGSGKSITALSITGLLPARAQAKGNIIFHDPNKGVQQLLHNKNIRNFRGSVISMVFQEPMTSLNPLIRCGEQVAEAYQSVKGSSASKAKQEAMEALSLSGFAIPNNVYRKYPHQLSGGQKQRVMIAMAIVCRPLLLIADEPTTALDVRIQHEVLGTLQELKKKLDMSVLLITHDLGIIADVADRVVIMHQGEVVEQGLTRKVLQNPAHAYTRALLNCRVAGYPKGVRLPSLDELLASPSVINDQAVKTPETETEKQVLLRVENLLVLHEGKRKKGEEKTRAVDDVTFSIYQNEILGLVGESGCGKTTLGRALLGLIKPCSGRVLLKEKDITGNKVAEGTDHCRELQIVFQDPYGSLNPRLTAGAALMEVLQVHQKGSNIKERKEKAIDLLQQVNLDADYFSRYPHQFSGGQRQRICIARALATEPSFIVFDEALSALDVSIQAQILNLINDLKNLFGFTALFISHDLALVNYISDRILVMRAGKIVEQGTAEEVFYHPRENYTRLLLDSIPGKNLA